MIEVQVICRVIQEKSLAILTHHGIGPEWFPQYAPEIDFIFGHHTKYGTVPDPQTFLAEFPDFELFTVNESVRYLIEALQEQNLYAEMVPVANEVARLITEDANRAIEYLKQEMTRLGHLQLRFKPGKDITKSALERDAEHKMRRDLKGLLGISSGIKELDEITHGWLKGEDLIGIAGRTNEGKSWLLLFFLIAAWAVGTPVLLYSGEMSELLVGFRFDTLYGHFNNSGLMDGHGDLGTDKEPKTADDYTKYCLNLSKTDVPFIIVTPKDIGGRLTVPTLHTLIEMYKPAIVGIDQLSLMDDARRGRGDSPVLGPLHICEDLYATTETYSIPILVPVQARRKDKKKKDAESEKEAPEMDDVYGSDGPAQNFTRLLTMKMIGPTMKVAIKKNRYGKKNQEVMLIWDVDRGVIKPFAVASTNDDGEGDAVPVGDYVHGEELF